MDVLQPRDLNEALAMKAERPEALPLAGGTDVMVELNFDMRRPEAIMDLTRVPELAEHSREDGVVRVGAGVTYTDLISNLAIELPGLAIASRTIGSPQIRNRGTVGGNLGTASPAGDALPVLLATNAQVEVASARTVRRLAMDEFITGPKKNALEPDEIITATLVPAATGPQQFSKIGTRNAMVIAVASFAIALDPPARRVGTGIGSAGPTPLRAVEAERFVAEYIAEKELWDKAGPIEERAAMRFGELAGAAASPIDDVRGSARYRHHAVAVMARRTLMWVWNEFSREGVRGNR
jgi:CO/xanthine dehydrogenase FAD-binding subunit